MYVIIRVHIMGTYINRIRDAHPVGKVEKDVKLVHHQLKVHVGVIALPASFMSLASMHINCAKVWYEGILASSLCTNILNKVLPGYPSRHANQ